MRTAFTRRGADRGPVMPQRGPSCQRNLRNQHTNQLSWGHAVTRQAGETSARYTRGDSRQERAWAKRGPLSVLSQLLAQPMRVSRITMQEPLHGPSNSQQRRATKVTHNAAGHDSGSQDAHANLQHLPRNTREPARTRDAETTKSRAVAG